MMTVVEQNTGALLPGGDEQLLNVVSQFAEQLLAGPVV